MGWLWGKQKNILNTDHAGGNIRRLDWTAELADDFIGPRCPICGEALRPGDIFKSRMENRRRVCEHIKVSRSTVP